MFWRCGNVLIVEHTRREAGALAGGSVDVAERG
jgi:hypothetical protein